MEIIYKYAWVMFIVITFANGQRLKYHSKKYIAENPELAQGYKKYFWGWIIFANIPWVIIMIGNLSGITQSFFEYLNPKALNPMVLIFHFSLLFLWLLGLRWIFFKKGAEFIEAHPGLMQKTSISGNSHLTAKQIKLFYLLILTAGITSMLMMWVMDFPIAK